ncbi:unnamed protein product [Ambrosiozyma monospora]|uniref:Unnamed protein product n=1 Tax=Ambrosiozyma monospora TaxID=43982 RepID=A0ACB5TCT6_AMBMO|nr:unnamed protein product [Ambrosiozyma monospora]
MLMDSIKRFPSLYEITIKVFSPTDEHPAMYRELAEVFSNTKTTTYLKLSFGTSFHFLNYPLLFKYIRFLDLSGNKFENCHALEDALGKCTSLRWLEMFDCSFPKDYKLKFRNDSLLRLEFSNFPFDLSGCPNLSRVLFSFSEPNHYIDTLN